MKLVCVKGDLLNNGCKLESVQLQLPDAGKRTVYFNHKTQQLLELMRFREDFRSWFVGNYIVQDGSLYMLTQVDPLLLLLHFLVKESGQFKDVMTLVKENIYFYKALTGTKAIDLSVLGELRDIDGNLFLKFNMQKALDYLKCKVHLLSKFIRANSIHASDSSYQIAGFSIGQQHNRNHDDNKRCAVELISTYLPPSLAAELKSNYSALFDETKIKPSSGLSAQSQEDKKRKHSNDGPLENYFSLVQENSSKKARTLTLAEKKLQKIDKTGIRSISSFFSKK